MKKRFISKLLMAALVVTMGVFSSCKDYDDDINANTALINQLQTQVDALKKAGDAAQADATKALENAAKAQQTANEALEKGEKGIADAAIAQKAAEEALAYAKKAEAEIYQKLANEVNDLNTKINQKVDQTEFNEMIDRLNNKDGELQQAIDKLAGELGDLTTLVNSNYTAVNNRIDSVINNFVTKGEFDVAIAGINLKIEALEKTDGELRTLIKANADSIDANAAAIKDLYQICQQIAVNRQLIDALDARVTTIENDYAKIEDVNTWLANLETKITAAYELAIANATAPLIEQLATIAQTLSDLQSTVADHTTAIANLNTAMANAEEALKTLNEVTIPAINALITDLQENKADKTVVDLLGQKVQKNIDDIAELFGRMEAVEAEAAKIAGILTQLGKIEDDITTLKNTTGNHETRIGELEQAKQQLETQLGQLANRMGIAESDISTLKGQMSTLLTETIPAINSAIANLENKIAVFVQFTNKNITSLVSKPDKWLYGLPMIDADVLKAQSVYEFTPGTNNGKYTERAKPSNEQRGYSFALTAKYWMNPHVANWEEYTYTMHEVAAQSYITRGNRDNKTAGIETIDTQNDVSYANGVLTVNFRFKNGEHVNDAQTLYEEQIITDGTLTGDVWNESETAATMGIYGLNPAYAWTTTIALQATRNNTEAENELGLTDKRMVTSDYAIVAPNYITRLLLGNSKYSDQEHGTEGNQKWHLFTDYNACDNENFTGVYGFELELDDPTSIDLNDFIDTHVFSGSEIESAQWDYTTIKEKGFDYKYTLLVNNDVWNMDGSEISIKEGQGKSANTGYDKAAIIRVELRADNKTWAYGYVSVLMKNKSLDLDVEIPELVLKCEPGAQTGTYQDFKATYDWQTLMDAIDEKLGQDMDWTLGNFVCVEDVDGVGPKAGPYKKFQNKNSEDEDNVTAGTIAHVGDNLEWSFTNAEVLDAFYAADGKTPLNTENYSVLIKIAPTTAGDVQGFAPIWITVNIGKVVYPKATFGFDQRIKSYWFMFQNKNTTDDPALRHEIHGSVEVYGQKDANDEFIYDFSSTFRTNRFKATGIEATNFDFSDNKVNAYFDASMYWVKPEGFSTGDVISNYPATSTAIGASGEEYLLYLEEAHATTLKAIKKKNGKFKYAKAQAVVTLSGDPYTDDLGYHNIGNFIATFHEYTYFDGNNKETYEYAYDLLNAAKHDQLEPKTAPQADKGKMAFTSHMILEIADYCLPVELEGEGHKFDIRYLRPISIDNMGEYVVYDAEDGVYDADGNIMESIVDGDANKTLIYLANIVKFVDWREVHFKVDNAGMKYVNYYGVRAINPNFDRAECDLDGVRELITDVTGKLKFTNEYIGTSEPSIDRTAQQFKEEIGYFLYENNSSVVDEFHIWLPLTIEYHWGVTADETVQITVIRTKANARQK